MSKFLLLFSTCFSLISFGQNLIPDPGFEMIDQELCGETTLPMLHWFNPNIATPDLLALEGDCGTILTAKYQEFTGSLPPVFGQGCVGLYCCMSLGSVNQTREYVFTQLTEPLQSGEVYQVSFQLFRVPYHDLAVDKIGIYFSEIAPQSSGPNVMEVEPQLETSGTLFMDTVWTTIQMEYTAAGGEQFLTLGNFRWPDEMTVLDTDSGPENQKQAYYQFDELNLQKVVSVPELNPFDNLRLSMNPCQWQILMKTQEEIALNVYSASGSNILRENMRNGRHCIDTNMLAPGLYIIQLQCGEFRRTIKIIKE